MSSRRPSSPFHSLHLEQWLNQLLCYVLLDSADIFCLDTLAVYLGWHALLLSDPGPFLARLLCLLGVQRVVDTEHHEHNERACAPTAWYAC